MEFALDIFATLAQAVPEDFHEYYAYDDPAYVESSLSIGQLLLFVLIGVGVNVLFGLWGKSRAEEFGVNPWVGFAAGFFLAYIGVRIVPLLRSDRLMNQPARRALGPPQATNPMYRPTGPPLADVPVHYNNAPPYPQPGPQYPPPGAVLYDASQPVAPMYPHAQPVAPAPMPAPQIAVDADGYFACPGCGQRVKAGRRNCMSCGVALPRVNAAQ